VVALSTKAWRSLGRVFKAEGQRDWMMSHASVPFAEPLGDGLFRIWFSPRDARNQSHIGWLTIDIANPLEVLELAETPVVSPGRLGGFDDCGAMMSWLLQHGDQRVLYYIGWNIRQPIPFHVSIGAAIGSASQPVSFTQPAGPILDRSPADPFFCSNPCVLFEDGQFRMWYLTGLGWEARGERYSASYQIAHAVSADGLSWSPTGEVAVPLEGQEFAIARPSVLRVAQGGGKGWEMWFSQRGRHHDYRLGAALSEDGRNWRRDSSVALLRPGVHDWASGMVAYPHVFAHHNTRYMLYCGDGFGQTGFGIAVLD
jgi:hypothetical protein